MAKEYYNTQVLAEDAAKGVDAKYKIKTRDQKRQGGTLFKWKLMPWWASGSIVAVGEIKDDVNWNGERDLRTSLVVSVDREVGELETLNTIYKLESELDGSVKSDYIDETGFKLPPLGALPPAELGDVNGLTPAELLAKMAKY